ncbi:TPA: RNA-binding domain-containing protein [Streptococcus agalactiae]|uniref:RNA-binding domain-containing protein n=1 Tax=Streptococcus agalactiae TaxID=1311 RepID=UPI000E250A4F|nr:RNA-binding domain-containing protein [Streptococcus agalactiae]RDY73499.1 AAA family ATPase [Streptococcus agalactiae]HEN2650358.1 putative DNA binding domain-containing protein [Streptococcus agalactiae]HEN9033031.1 putative DNA binding domain-containing protein [Streptococcus agalactiae]HEN9831481.1 putative DNA binding domain-containing protein [Streptococcus agalactiae]HEN9926346.1 putative DNA binding domain-containing protein [Streptococcus agalactiae]
MKLKIEGNDLEYKKAKNALPDSFWETYSAFANTNGGKIILGIDEKNEDPYQGVNDPQRIRDNLFALVANKQKVSCNLLTDNDIEYVNIPDKNRQLMVITIREASSDQKPVHLKNDFRESYKRLGEGDVRLDKEELKYLMASSHDDIDSELLTNYDESDLNIESIREYKKLLIELSGNTKYINMPLRDFLTEIGVFKKDRTDGSYKLTAGGLLFFGKYNSIISRYPKFQLDYFEKDNSLTTRWNDRVSTGDMMYPDLNMYDFFNLTYKKLTATTNDRFELNDESAHRLPFKKDLSESIREALVNCLMHAYYDFDSPIAITAYNDFYEFKNPGKMKISIPEFIHGGTSKTRNSTISSLFRRIGMSEKAGSGGPKIFDVSEKYKLKIPEVSTTFDSTIVTIWKVDLLSSYQDISKDEKAILKYIIENGSISKNDVIENNLMTEYRFRESLKTLQNKKYIEIVGKGRSTKYVLPRTSSEQYHIIKQQIKNLGDFMTKH